MFQQDYFNSPTKLFSDPTKFSPPQQNRSIVCNIELLFFCLLKIIFKDLVLQNFNPNDEYTLNL